MIMTVALDIVNKHLLEQKQFIWRNMCKVQSENEKLFYRLCHFGEVTNAVGECRQDRIEGGIVASVNELEMYNRSIDMGDTYKNFEIGFENNTKVYLTECLLFAHSNNQSFQHRMKQYFNKEIGIRCKYQGAPVKLNQRCVIKSTSDYARKPFPSVANILDFLRFSVTFDKVCL